VSTQWWAAPKFIRRMNFWATIIWLALIYPTIVVWNKSILWVGFLSVWANFISHYTAWVAARVEVRAQALQEADRDRIEHTENITERMERQNLELLLWMEALYKSVCMMGDAATRGWQDNPDRRETDI